MQNNDPRQRIRREEIHYQGTDRTYVIRTEEHSAFLENGNIVSRKRVEIPAAQGIIPHKPTDVAGQCPSCSNFTTKLLVCDLCWEVVCLPCAGQKDKFTVCPACYQYLEHRHRIQILRKLFIEPFIERVS